MKRILFAAFCVSISTLLVFAAPQQRRAKAGFTIADAVRAVIVVPEEQIDFAKAKLAVDRIVDRKLQPKKALAQIETMRRAVLALAGPSPSEAQKLSALRKYLYDSGTWNDRKPFGYDLADPYGAKISNKLLSNYLESRRGNCVSMPILLMILGNRLGLKMTLAVAPRHIFVKYTEAASAKTYNLEATSGGYPARDAWYRQNMSMSEDAIRTGLYMKALSNRQTLALMSGVVMELLMEEERFQEAAKVADVIVEFHPTDVGAILTQGIAAMEQIDRRIQGLYPNPSRHKICTGNPLSIDCGVSYDMLAV